MHAKRILSCRKLCLFNWPNGYFKTFIKSNWIIVYLSLDTYIVLFPEQFIDLWTKVCSCHEIDLSDPVHIIWCKSFTVDYCFGFALISFIWRFSLTNTCWFFNTKFKFLILNQLMYLNSDGFGISNENTFNTNIKVLEMSGNQIFCCIRIIFFHFPAFEFFFSVLSTASKKCLHCKFS